jgi:pimeloyl-ACP methyl ester carboxylesterase
MSVRGDSSDDPGTGWAARTVAWLNGAVGDYLHDSGNALATEMAFYHRHRPLTLSKDALREACPRATAKICILVHGLGCNEGVWTYPEPHSSAGEVTYGHLLERDLGFTSFSVRYNSGLALEENGARLAVLFDELLAAYPVPVEEIVLIGHSMGGLVLQSAGHSGLDRHSPWVRHVRRVFYLGTPHDGADLEKLGHATTTVLRAVPNPITALVADVIDRRSQGVKDLRTGAPLRAEEAPRGAHQPTHRRGIPWLSHARHYLIAGSLTTDPQHAASVVFGDGLVRHGRPSSRDPHTEHVRLLPGVHHLALAHHPRVYDTIRAWCQEA